jgi:5-methylcytosine-specific restriction endonuclease McrA
MKRDKYTCQTCGVKQSRKRGEEVFVEEHHIDGVDWQFLIDEIYRVLLVPPNRLTTECRKCHDLEKKP